jgi:O-methyltransferase
MKAVLAAHGVTDRRLYVADSFAGLPKPDPSRYPVDRQDTTYQEAFLAVSQETVMDNFRKYDLLDDRVVFLKGWFKDTLPHAPIEKLAVMRLDGDLYQSTWEALTWLYPKLSAGGYCIIDDYALAPCRQAVDDFRRQNGITDPIERIDWTGAYWKRSGS